MKANARQTVDQLPASVSHYTAAARPPKAFLARFFSRLVLGVRRLFKKEPADNPNIYPFF
jgi:hypothetical protein